MFGMLDYRAHKLYKLIFFIPSIFLYLVGLIVLPAASLLVASEFGGNAITFTLYAILAILVFETIFQIIATQVILRFFSALFNFLVDVVPANGRNKEQAINVAAFGRLAELNLKFSEHPRTWLDEDIEEFGDFDWVQRLFFNGKTKKRMYAVRAHYLGNEEEFLGAASIEKFLNKENIAASFWEKFLVNKMYRVIMLRYSIVLLGVIYILSTKGFV